MRFETNPSSRALTEQMRVIVRTIGCALEQTNPFGPRAAAADGLCRIVPRFPFLSAGALRSAFAALSAIDLDQLESSDETNVSAGTLAVSALRLLAVVAKTAPESFVPDRFAGLWRFLVCDCEDVRIAATAIGMVPSVMDAVVALLIEGASAGDTPIDRARFAVECIAEMGRPRGDAAHDGDWTNAARLSFAAIRRELPCQRGGEGLFDSLIAAAYNVLSMIGDIVSPEITAEFCELFAQLRSIVTSAELDAAFNAAGGWRPVPESIAAVALQTARAFGERDEVIPAGLEEALQRMRQSGQITEEEFEQLNLAEIE